jgi:hypothetical protein
MRPSVRGEESQQCKKEHAPAEQRACVGARMRLVCMRLLATSIEELASVPRPVLRAHYVLRVYVPRPVLRP